MEGASVGGTASVSIAIIEGEKQTVVAIDERAGIEQLDIDYFVLLDIQDIHTGRVAFKVASGQEGVRRNVIGGDERLSRGMDLYSPVSSNESGTKISDKYRL